MYFQEEVLGNENYSVDMNMLTGNSAIVSAVQGDQGGIGYVGIGYANTSGINVVEPEGDPIRTLHTARWTRTPCLSGDYILSRYLYIYTDGTPTRPGQPVAGLDPRAPTADRAWSAR